jgi:hypothetical protein
MADALARSGWYGEGPSPSLPEGTSALQRLLDLTGRRP